jgi:hypothetical protein
MKKSHTITHPRLLEVVVYNPEDGSFRWRIKKGKKFAGDLCGTLSHGYMIIGIDRVRYKAHRLAWLYVYGELPDKHIDHINRQKDDNRISNLRLCNDQQNGENVFLPLKNSTSGYRGVFFEAGKWRAKIWKQRKQIHLGRHVSAEAAHAAYLKAKQELHSFAAF